MLRHLIERLAHIGSWLYALEAFLIYAEDALFFGFVFPAEITLVFCAFLAQQHVLSLWLVAVIAIVAAVAGDQTGFRIGHHFGPAIRASRLGRRINAHSWETARDLLEERRGVAVFLGRWTLLLRSLVPTSSGIIGMHWGTFTLWNVIGGISWALAWSAVGYLAGASWETAAARFGEVVAVAMLLLLTVVVLLWARRRKNVAHRHDADAL